MLKKTAFLLLLASFLCSCYYLDKKFEYPFKVVDISLAQNQPPIEEYTLADLSGIVFGVRKMAADIAWIQLLQYYGGKEESEEKHAQECKEHDHEHCADGVNYGKGRYKVLQKHTQRIVRLDPFFTYAYIYGGACLAWNLDRPDEGIAVFNEGIKNVPNQWQLYLYKMAIIYKKLDKYNQMVGELEKALKQPDCPVMVKAILANIYRKNENYIRALQIWVEIYDANESEYHEKSEKEIQELRAMTGL
ncbi:MAG: hypothetical protein A2252_11560 [Elusimicrobia bacterium RIFOXYA2_FULL_39_19]|nr:MAG: hypothetical protein A2252_11560 [Elusimicrobia bacterium RIFOXYA2_FULL_39_19]